MTNFVTDSFTATAGTALASHTSDSGASWTLNSQFGSGALVISPSGDLRTSNINNTFYSSSATPPSANYVVGCTVDFVTAPPAASDYGVTARASATADTCYAWAWVFGSGFLLLKRVAGAVTVLATYTGYTPAVGTPFTIEIDVNGTTISGKINGTTVESVTDSAISAVGLAGLTMVDGNGAATDSTLGHIRNFYATAITAINLSTPTQYQTFQRTSAGMGSIAITGTNGDTASHSIEASFNGGAYATIATGVTAGSAFAGTLTNQAQGQGTLTVRFVDAPSTTATATQVGIGDVYVLAGQSNAVGQITTNQSAYHQTLVATCFKLSYTWAAATDPLFDATGQVDSVPSNNGTGTSGHGGTYWMSLATILMANNGGVPVAFIPTAQDGAGLASPQSGSGYQWTIPSNHQDRTTLYGAMVYRALQAGGIKAVLWHQGETDAINGVSQTTYSTALINLAGAIKTDLNCPLIVCKFQKCTAGSPTQNQQAAINAALALGGANITVGPDLSTMSATSVDGLHLFNQADAYEAAAKWGAVLLGSSSSSSVNPTIYRVGL